MSDAPAPDPREPADPSTRFVGPWAELRRDQWERWQQGECPHIEHYLQREPALAESPEGLCDLIRGEIQLRQERGEKPLLEEYLQRFPQVAVELRQRYPLGLDPLGFRVTGIPLSFPSLPKGRSRPPFAREGSEHPQVPGYEILEELGRGGMGVVYQARQLQLDRLVALKMILAGIPEKSEEYARFRSEAEAIARLQHPNIVQIYEVGAVSGRPYFALEFVNGGSLAGRHGDEAVWAPHRAAQLMAIVARAVRHCHERGIVHRDLKPGNILLQYTDDESALRSEFAFAVPGFPPCVPKITDFGLAKRLDLTLDQTRTGNILGTPSFMAPEQAAGQSNIGPAADIYALGGILYHLLTGRPPFQGDSVLAVLDQLRSEEPLTPTRLNPKVPRDLETICLKCLEKDPLARYATARHLADDLQRFLDDEPIQARPVGAWKRGWKWVRRNPLSGALLGLVAFAAVALACLTLFSSWNARRLIEDRQWVEHTLEVLVEQQHLSFLLKEAEASQRSYLLTGDQAYLGPYGEATAEIPRVLDRLIELTSDNPGQTIRLVALRGKIDDRLKLLRAVIALRAPPAGLEAAIRAVQAGQGKRSMDGIQALLAAVEAEERRLLGERNAAEEATTRTATLVLVASVVLATVLLTTALLPLVRAIAPQWRRRGKYR